MARERIIVKEAINALKYLLNQLIKNDISNSKLSIDEIVLNSNLFSFAIRFLRDIGKVGAIVDELTSRLSVIGEYLIRSIDTNNLDDCYLTNIEDYRVYELQIYPLARILEALGGISNLPANNRNNNSYLIQRVMNIILYFFNEEELLETIFDTNQKYVPIVQGILSSIDKISEKNTRYCIDITLDKIRKLAVKNDPEMRNIATQDVFYLIKLRGSELLSEEEAKPLYTNLKSRIFKRVLKGIEYLTMFGIEPPQSAVDYVLSIMPKFFSEIFRVGNSNSTFIYFSSIAESMHNILSHYNNKAFAQAMMNYLIEDTGWIARNNYSHVDFIKTVIGTSLLIQARGAIRR